MGTGRGADLTKLLFVVLDVMRKRNVDLFESMEMIGEHPGIRSEQGNDNNNNNNTISAHPPPVFCLSLYN